MFDTFQNRLTVEGYLVAKSALHVGTGRIAALSGTELPVIRDVYDAPFVPGSSLKGALRSHLEALVRGRVSNGTKLERVACDPTSKDSTCLDAARMRDLKAKHSDDAELAQALSGELCLMCQTFGSPWWASPVRVRDLPVVADEWFGQFDVRDGVAIDRDKGTVAVGPYDYETVPAGTRFELRIVAENLAKWQRGLLWLGLRALKRGDIALGGFSSRGLGWVELQDPRIHFLEGAAAILDLIGGAAAGQEVEDDEATPWVNAFHKKLNEKGAQDA
jgi:CRISPR-associated RAMP protein (TIGR02581 family)